MRVLHTIEGLGAKFGGIATCTFDLLSVMQNGNDTVEILSPSLKNEEDKYLAEGCEWSKTYVNDGIGPFNYSRNLKRELLRSDFDLYHANGMWQYIVHRTCSHARKKGKPYVITPHGMLYPEALARSSWKKWPLRKLWFDNDILNASCIHVTCEDEMQHIRCFGYRGPIALIGNPVSIPDYTKDILKSRGNKVDPLWGVAFLGRLHPIKKVENLLYGVALSGIKQVNVFIIGKGDDVYEQFLRNESQRLGITDRVHFLGFLNGRDKFERLAQVDALFVPSDMENFGMIVPESLLVGTPVMASLGTPWRVLNEERCGWWCSNSPKEIAKVIDGLYKLSNNERFAMGCRGRKHILHTYSADMIASKMTELYRWLLEKCPKPDFVYEN